MSKVMISRSIMWAGAIIVTALYLDWLWLILLVPMALGDLYRSRKARADAMANSQEDG